METKRAVRSEPIYHLVRSRHFAEWAGSPHNATHGWQVRVGLRIVDVLDPVGPTRRFSGLVRGGLGAYNHPGGRIATRTGGRWMIPGIDPKIDIAFEKVFGSERCADLTAALINAVRFGCTF